MLPPLRCALRPLSSATRAYKNHTVNKIYFRGVSTSQPESDSRSRTGSRKGAFIVAAIAGAAAAYLLYPKQTRTESSPARLDIKLEEPRKKARSREENRDLISSQHLQVKRSWENPGVYAWGTNIGRVAAPDSDEIVIRKPTRIACFDGKVLRDVKLDRYFGAAIAENGDLLQWGTGFSSANQGPTPTLKGKNLVKISISRDRIIALSSNGTIYSVPVCQADYASEPKHQEQSWFNFWNRESSPGYRMLKPANLGWGEKVTDISSGQEHCLILTSAGRVFSSAISIGSLPSKGQLGVSALALTKTTAKHFDEPNEITALKGYKICKIATGDYHSLVLDDKGTIFSFGDNSAGQLGFDRMLDAPIVATPSILSVDKLYKGSNLSPRVTNIAAGGLNSFFTVDAVRVTAQTEADPQGLSHITADTWACGQGILGALGSGRWTHIQDTPTKVKSLSGLCEYDEVKDMVVPIRVAGMSIGSTHASATLDNKTHLGANSFTSKNATNWGSDVLLWGGNEFYQLGTGKRNNVNSPTYIPPLDFEADIREKGDEHRFQITPRKKISVGGRKVSVEQRIECGKGVTAVYSGT